MPRRRTQRPDSRLVTKDDNPMDLTGAFAPVRGPQSVDYDSDDDPLGLTNAFSAIPPRDAPNHNWPNGNKWSGFDWDAEKGDASESGASQNGSSQGSAHRSSKHADAVGSHSRKGSASLHRANEISTTGKSASKNEGNASAKAGKRKGSKQGRHAAAEKELTPRMKKSKRVRRVLIVLLILLFIVLGVLGYFTYQTFVNSQHEAAQQTSDKANETTVTDEIEQTEDAKESLTRLADVPNLTSLLGMTQDEAIAAVGRGAYVKSSLEVNEEGNPIKQNVSIALTEEVADSKTGSTPTVYLGLGEDGRVRQAGYSASAAALGFGSHSFEDAVEEDHVVETTLEKAGVNIATGSAVLPDDVAAYTTYASDGKVTAERCSFEGEVEVNNVACVWSAVLSYDYTVANLRGNLSDTLRIIYVYITMR